MRIRQRFRRLRCRLLGCYYGPTVDCGCCGADWYDNQFIKCGLLEQPFVWFRRWRERNSCEECGRTIPKYLRKEGKRFCCDACCMNNIPF